MKLFSKKLDIITLLAIVLMAISFSMLDFDNLTWNANVKAYLGLIAVVVLFIFKLINWKSSSEN